MAQKCESRLGGAASGSCYWCTILGRRVNTSEYQNRAAGRILDDAAHLTHWRVDRKPPQIKLPILVSGRGRLFPLLEFRALLGALSAWLENAGQLCHCEERSDAAIPRPTSRRPLSQAGACRVAALLAMTCSCNDSGLATTGSRSDGFSQ